MSSSAVTAAHRHEQVPFDIDRDAKTNGSHVIQTILSKVPGVKLYTRSSPRFESLRGVYNSMIVAQPLAICRPRTIPHIQSIAKAVEGLDIPLAVRCGGHDVWGRGCIADSVTIDMREMDTQVLAEDQQTVTVGGGITSDNFVSFLDTHGLCTANGTVGTTQTQSAEECKKWLDLVRGLGTVLVDTVSETTYKAFQASLSEHFEQPRNCDTLSASIPRFTSTSLEKIMKCIEDIPDTRSYVVVGHIQHGKGTRPNPSSCFGTRQPHILLHFIVFDEAAQMEEATSWATGLVADLKSTGETMDQPYVSFMAEDEDASKSFGGNWERLKTLKKRVDGKNVFRFAQPKLPVV